MRALPPGKTYSEIKRSTGHTRPHSTYHADCLCGKPITSETRETKCEACGRLLVFEWGGYLFDPVTVTDGVQTKHAVVIVGAKAKGASA